MKWKLKSETPSVFKGKAFIPWERNYFLLKYIHRQTFRLIFRDSYIVKS